MKLDLKNENDCSRLLNVIVPWNDLKEKTLASPAVADGALFIRTANHLWRFQR